MASQIKMAYDVHNYRRSIEKLLTNVQNSEKMSEKNKNSIINFYENPCKWVVLPDNHQVN